MGALDAVSTERRSPKFSRNAAPAKTRNAFSRERPDLNPNMPAFVPFVPRPSPRRRAIPRSTGSRSRDVGETAPRACQGVRKGRPGVGERLDRAQSHRSVLAAEPPRPSGDWRDTGNAGIEPISKEIQERTGSASTDQVWPCRFSLPNSHEGVARGSIAAKPGKTVLLGLGRKMMLRREPPASELATLGCRRRPVPDLFYYVALAAPVASGRCPPCRLLPACSILMALRVKRNDWGTTPCGS